MFVPSVHLFFAAIPANIPFVVAPTAHPPCWAARKKLRAVNQEAAAKATSGILSLRSPNRVVADPSQVRAVPSLLSHRHLFRSLSTMRLLLDLATCAQASLTLVILPG